MPRFSIKQGILGYTGKEEEKITNIGGRQMPQCRAPFPAGFVPPPPPTDEPRSLQQYAFYSRHTNGRGTKFTTKCRPLSESNPFHLNTSYISKHKLEPLLLPTVFVCESLKAENNPVIDIITRSTIFFFITECHRKSFLFMKISQFIHRLF